MLDNDEKNSQCEVSTLSKPQNIFHTIATKDIINNKINNIVINKNNNTDIDEDENIKLLKSQKNPMKFNKIDKLFEISESQRNNNKKNDSSQSEKSSLENNKKDDNTEVKKVNSRKNVNGFVKNNRLGFIIRDKSRKATKRIKKLGMNENDFLI